MTELDPIDLGAERLKRREVTDIGGIALSACLRNAVAEGRISPDEATERLQAYLDAYTLQPSDPA